MSNHAEAMMQDQIEGAQSKNEVLRCEIERLRTELLCAQETAKKWQGLAEAAKMQEELQAKRVGRKPLTDGQIETLSVWGHFDGLRSSISRKEITRAIEQAHGIK